MERQFSNIRITHDIKSIAALYEVLQVAMNVLL